MGPHRDRLAKRILEETLDSVGATRREFEVDPGYLPRADFCFLPLLLPPEPEWPLHRRLLYRMVRSLCMFEVCSHPPDKDEVLDFHYKQMGVRNRRRQQQESPWQPWLWVLSCGRPVSAFAELGVEPAPGWPAGFYRMAAWSQIGIVVLGELERTRETLVLRLMGPAPVQKEALAEIQVIPETDPEHQALTDLVTELRHAIERDSLIPQEDREAFMTAARAEFEKFKTEVYSQGIMTSIQDLWGLRFGGPVQDELTARLTATADPRLLRQVLAIIARAANPGIAESQIHALLPPLHS